MTETALVDFGVTSVMAGQEEDSESHKVPFTAPRIFWASVKEELRSLRVRPHALVQLGTAPRFPNSC